MQAKKPLIILACAAALALLGTAGYFLYQHFWAPKAYPISTYVCADASHYVVIEEEDALIVSGTTFARAGEGANRYVNGSAEIEISEGSLTLRNTETGTEVVTCPAGVPAAGLPPVRTQQ